MLKPFGIVLFIVGIGLLVAGFFASESIASSFSKAFTGEPTDHAIWLMLMGVVAITAGSVLGWRGSRD